MNRWPVRVLCTLALFVIGGACAAQSVTPTVLGPGWQCLLVPSSFDGPGTIFSVSAEGIRSHVTDLRARKLVTVQTGRTGFGKMTDNHRVNGNIAVSLIEKAFPGVGAKLSAAGHQMKGAATEYGDVQQEITETSNLDPAVEKWFAKNIKPVEGVRYFVVREAYLAGYVYYHFTKEDLAGLGGEGNFRSIFHISGEISRGSDASYELDQMFKPPVRVCIQASEIAKTRGLNGAVEYHVVKETGDVPSIQSSAP